MIEVLDRKLDDAETATLVASDEYANHRSNWQFRQWARLYEDEPYIIVVIPVESEASSRSDRVMTERGMVGLVQDHSLSGFLLLAFKQEDVPSWCDGMEELGGFEGCSLGVHTAIIMEYVETTGTLNIGAREAAQARTDFRDPAWAAN